MSWILSRTCATLHPEAHGIDTCGHVNVDQYISWCTISSGPRLVRHVSLGQSRENTETQTPNPATFGAVRSKFWQNLTFPHCRCQNRRTGLKSSPNGQNSAISMKSAQNARLGTCGAKSHFSVHQMSKSSYWPQIIVKSGTQSDFHKNCTKQTFGAVRSKFWQILTFPHSRCQNRRNGLKPAPNQESVRFL